MPAGAVSMCAPCCTNLPLFLGRLSSVGVSFYLLVVSHGAIVNNEVHVLNMYQTPRKLVKINNNNF